MACLETSFLVDILKKEISAGKLMNELENFEPRLVVASPSIKELWAGALLSKKKEQEKAKINELMTNFEVLSLDENSAKEAAEIEFELTKKGLPIDVEDVMIAAIAKTNGEKVVTRDEHFVRVSGLKVLKY
ncbi:MAG: PIN domain-containing protein [Candidatus Woesearchaeota archaeon]